MCGNDWQHSRATAHLLTRGSATRREGRGKGTRRFLYSFPPYPPPYFVACSEGRGGATSAIAFEQNKKGGAPFYCVASPGLFARFRPVATSISVLPAPLAPRLVDCCGRESLQSQSAYGNLSASNHFGCFYPHFYLNSLLQVTTKGI